MAEQSGGRADHILGTCLVLGSAIAFSFTGALTKTIHSDVWTIACWRGLIGAAMIMLYVVCRWRGQPAGGAFKLGWRGWVLATVGSVASIAFIASFKLTYVANVAVIYATVPFVAAFFERLALGERFRRSTMTAAGVSLIGVAIMVFGGIGTGNLLGDSLAIAMTFGSALYMVLIRVFRETPVVLAGAASSLQLFVFGWFVTDPLAVSRDDVLLLVLFGMAFSLAVILWTEGTRLIPAAESGLLGAADVPLALLFAWIILAELPPAASFLGGGIVLAAVVVQGIRNLLLSAVESRRS